MGDEYDTVCEVSDGFDESELKGTEFWVTWCAYAPCSMSSLSRETGFESLPFHVMQETLYGIRDFSAISRTIGRCDRFVL